MSHRYKGQKLGPLLECSDSGVPGTRDVKKMQTYKSKNQNGIEKEP